ncbi:alpha/beta hydrolase [Bdellovibrio bacteriovorus]|uniref:Alpha/beta hydrolase n=1 Tax=Bdellovibrio bacteriovorus TaxID=959 RepID=A0A150WM92_BDEBC|nr:patatin-like phospholipase family protein [Bdellovibrio bacteriovorus]KYG65611.1 alpha/beta hydrolase [Bdellovibrio bacteriovorus]
MSRLGLVLSGGGARGAYQAGVLAAIAHIAQKIHVRDPFQIYSGVSAGAINVGMLAATSDDFVTSATRLADSWRDIDSDQIFYADFMALSRGGLQWMTELSLGSSKKDQALRSLLSTQPLHGYLSQKCHFEEIEKKIKKGTLHAVGISALEYESISTVTFFQGAKDLHPWERGMHRSERAILGPEHIMASSAIPLLFPPIKIGERYYGDGCIRNQSPCGPAIYMGAEKLIAIGVRRRQDTSFKYHHNKGEEIPTVSRVADVLMNAVMMDGLEADVQRLDNINKNYRLLSAKERARVALHEIEHLWISPSVDFAEIASKRKSELPRMIRYLLKGPGSLDESAEMMSYLLFTPSYCRQLIDIGFADGMKEKERIAQILMPKTKKSALRLEHDFR